MNCYLERVGVSVAGVSVLLITDERVPGLDGLTEPVQHLVVAPRSFIKKFAPPITFLGRLLPAPHLIPGLGGTGGHPGVVRVLRVGEGLRVGVRQGA